jgi:hypothetical protein
VRGRCTCFCVGDESVTKRSRPRHTRGL